MESMTAGPLSRPFPTLSNTYVHRTFKDDPILSNKLTHVTNRAGCKESGGGDRAEVPLYPVLKICI